MVFWGGFGAVFRLKVGWYFFGVLILDRRISVRCYYGAWCSLLGEPEIVVAELENVPE